MNKALGTASWLDPSNVIDRYSYAPDKFWLGRSPTNDDSAIGYNDDRHICLVSGNRGGKGTTVIVNNLVLWPGSIVVVDPKGENAIVTARRRGPGSPYCEGMGQDVHILAPFDIPGLPDELRSRFNPMDALDPAREETVDEAARLADALVVQNPDSKDPFWDESARAMVKALILHILTGDEFEGRRSLVTLRDLVTRGDEEKVELLKQIGEADIPSAHELLWEGVRQNTHFDGVINRAGASFANMLSASPKQYESVRQVADRNTEFVDSPGMQRCLAASDFKLSDLKTKAQGLSLYLSLPQRYMATHFRWLRMMIALTITEMEATPGRPACGHRVLFCLDEFAGLKRMEVIENAVAQIAGYGVKLMFVLQSLEQLKGTYTNKWETFLGNCGLKIFFSLEDLFTRKHVSETIGDTEVVRASRTASETFGTQEGRSETNSFTSGVSLSEQTSTSTSESLTRSKGKSMSTAKGRSRGRSWGSNWGLNLGHNSSDGTNWKPQNFFGGRKDEQYSDSSGWNKGGSYGRNNGRNEGDSVTHTTGTNESESRTIGASQTHSKGVTFSESVTVGQGTSYSESRSSTDGVNESVHKRRLITEDEIGIVFQRLTQKDHPAYPGLALVLVSGEDPAFVRKVNYYEDPQFIGCYDPHPDHEYRPLIEQTARLNGPSGALLEALNRHASVPFHISNLWIENGQKIEAGMPLFEIEGEAFGKRTATVKAGLKGRIAELPIDTPEYARGEDGFHLSPGTLAVVTYYGEEQPLSNPYGELEAMAREIEEAWEKSRIAPPPLPPPRPAKKQTRWSTPLLWVAMVGLLFCAIAYVVDGFRSKANLERQPAAAARKQQQKDEAYQELKELAERSERRRRQKDRKDREEAEAARWREEQAQKERQAREQADELVAQKRRTEEEAAAKLQQERSECLDKSERAAFNFKVNKARVLELCEKDRQARSVTPTDELRAPKVLQDRWREARLAQADEACQWSLDRKIDEFKNESSCLDDRRLFPAGRPR